MVTFIDGTNNSETITGTDDHDMIHGFGGDDIIFGGAGDDAFFGGAGADFLDGGTGTFDTAFYSDSTTAVTVNLALGFGRGGTAEGDRLVNIDDIVGSQFGDTLIGNDGSNRLMGEQGDDRLMGGFGADLLFGADGGGDVNATAGIDTAVYIDSPVGVTVNLATGRGFGGTAEGDQLFSIEQLEGSFHDDILTGNDVANFFTGNAGNDILKGAGGADILFGNTGDDTLKGGGGADVLEGGAGIDTAAYNDSAAGVFVSLITNTAAYGDAEGDQLFNIENLTGSIQHDDLWGNDAANVLNGNSGNDTLKGYGGADLLIGATGNDLMYGMDGDDTLRGEEGADTMEGGRGTDLYIVDNVSDVVREAVGEGTFDRVQTSVSYSLAAAAEVEVLETTNPSGTTAIDLVGNGFNNTIIGNNGQNTIVGGAGLDAMRGNGGGDLFVWSSVAETGATVATADLVADFNRGQGDLIGLNLIDANETVAGDQAFTFIGNGPFTAPGQIAVASDGTDTFLLLNTDADLAQEAVIRVVGVQAVDSSWFVL